MPQSADGEVPFKIDWYTTRFLGERSQYTARVSKIMKRIFNRHMKISKYIYKKNEKHETG